MIELQKGQAKMSCFVSGFQKLIVGVFVCIALTAQAFAQQQQLTPEQEEFLNATAFSVDEIVFTNRDLNVAAVDFADELSALPAEERRSALINILIDMMVLAREAEKEKLGEIEVYKKRLEQLRARTLRNAYVAEKIIKEVDDEQIQDLYVEELARFEPVTQTRARHILVDTKEQAEEVINELNDGKDFAVAAQEKSQGPSAPNGGDLGFFSPGRMVPAFEEATNALEVGSHSSEPVETQFGWHVIKVEARRDSEAPTFAQIAPQLRGVLAGDLIAKKVAELRGQSKIVITPDPNQDVEENAAEDTEAASDAEEAPSE